MKKILAIAGIILLGGCATKDQLYYDAAKAISKDNTISQTACWSAISDIAKGGNEGAKIGAIALAEKCKSQAINVAPPPRNILGF